MRARRCRPAQRGRGRLAPHRAGQKPRRVTQVDVYAKVRADAAGATPDLPLELRTGGGASLPDVLAGAPLRLVPGLGLSAASADVDVLEGRGAPP